MSKGFMPKRRTVKLTFEGTEFEGLEVEVSLSFPFGLLEAARSGDESAVLDLMPYMLVSWNLLDMATGEPLPCNADGIRKAPFDLLMHIFAQAMQRLEAGGLLKNAETPSGGN